MRAALSGLQLMNVLLSSTSLFFLAVWEFFSALPLPTERPSSLQVFLLLKPPHT